MSNIGSRTFSTLVLLLLLLPHALVLGYYYASNIVLEETMMQVSFGLTTPTFQEFSFFFLGRKGKESKTINTSASWDLRRVVV